MGPKGYRGPWRPGLNGPPPFMALSPGGKRPRPLDHSPIRYRPTGSRSPGGSTRPRSRSPIRYRPGHSPPHRFRSRSPPHFGQRSRSPPFHGVVGGSPLRYRPGCSPPRSDSGSRSSSPPRRRQRPNSKSSSRSRSRSPNSPLPPPRRRSPSRSPSRAKSVGGGSAGGTTAGGVRIRTTRAYSFGGPAGGAAAVAGGVVAPAGPDLVPGWVRSSGLKPAVQHQLVSMYETRRIGTEDLDPACMDGLSVLTEDEGLEALAELNKVDFARIKNLAAFLVGICRRISTGRMGGRRRFIGGGPRGGPPVIGRRRGNFGSRSPVRGRSYSPRGYSPRNYSPRGRSRSPGGSGSPSRRHAAARRYSRDPEHHHLEHNGRRSASPPPPGPPRADDERATPIDNGAAAGQGAAVFGSQQQQQPSAPPPPADAATSAAAPPVPMPFLPPFSVPIADLSSSLPALPHIAAVASSSSLQAGATASPLPPLPPLPGGSPPPPPLPSLPTVAPLPIAAAPLPAAFASTSATAPPLPGVPVAAVPARPLPPAVPVSDLAATLAAAQLPSTSAPNDPRPSGGSAAGAGGAITDPRRAMGLMPSTLPVPVMPLSVPVSVIPAALPPIANLSAVMSNGNGLPPNGVPGGGAGGSGSVTAPSAKPLLREAIADFVKEVLKPAWRAQQLSRESFKLIAKKTVDKVLAAAEAERGKGGYDNPEGVRAFFSAARKAKIVAVVEHYKVKHGDNASAAAGGAAAIGRT